MFILLKLLILETIGSNEAYGFNVPTVPKVKVTSTTMCHTLFLFIFFPKCVLTSKSFFDIF